MFTARYGLNLRVMYINPSKPSGHYMYRQFNIQQFYVLPHSVFMCFVWISEQTAIISLSEELLSDSYTDILRGHGKFGCGLETISFPTTVTKDGSRWREMCFVCLKPKEQKKNAVNSAILLNVCARTALSGISSKKQQLQGTVTIQRNCIHTWFNICGSVHHA